MFRQKPPGEGGGRKPVQFSYTPTLPGQTWTGFLAGPPQWIDCHTHREKPSKPCLAWITHGALPCPRCTPAYMYETLGYVPIYRESDHRECVVVIRETARDLIEGLEFPDYVCVSKETGKADRVTVSKHPKQKKWLAKLPERKVPADLQYSLLTMWRITELTEWIRCQPASAPVPTHQKIDTSKPPTPAQTALALNLDEIAKAMDSQGDRARATAERAGMAAEFLRRKAAEQNGKHD